MRWNGRPVEGSQEALPGAMGRLLHSAEENALHAPTWRLCCQPPLYPPSYWLHAPTLPLLLPPLPAGRRSGARLLVHAPLRRGARTDRWARCGAAVCTTRRGGGLGAVRARPRDAPPRCRCGGRGCVWRRRRGRAWGRFSWSCCWWWGGDAWGLCVRLGRKLRLRRELQAGEVGEPGGEGRVENGCQWVLKKASSACQAADS